ncbi:uncharacterized protein BX663DRAFT_519398 [Cokeromyces recurvatus]|uniref:uncharacterized protein n=1 Tax=Cokeromyces recurvatus TaxID=90255 RepID=UPI002220BC52|nr:uncharacterized protein BX663DRAFT_519398 [Cokeromyces recurvatus]KAI7900036.1 hypothetical protein BX663DRAFT_519398 [Cokeromyces recurvatus]
MNSFSALADPNDPIDPTDVEFFKFTSLVPDAKVSIQEGSFEISKYDASVSLMACSSKFGYFVSATINGFIFSSTKALRKAFYGAEKSSTVQFEGDKIAISLLNPIRQIRITGDEKQILVATEGAELLVYNVDDIKKDKTEVKPIHTFNLTNKILDLRPNPEALLELAAVLFENNQCKIINITNGDVVCEIPSSDISAICWSPKGKQIVCGKLDGSLQHFDTTGASKDALSIPEAMSAGHGEETENRYVQDVLWIENHIFLTIYARKRTNEEDDYINDGYIINRKPKSGTSPEYIRLAEITPIFTTEGRGNHFYMEIIRGLGKEIKHLVVIANAASSDISVVGEGEDGEWATWQLPENGLANLPLTEESAMDTYPVGLALDFSADEKLPPLDPSESDIEVEPFPVLYYMNDEGRIGAYHCFNFELARRGESYKTAANPATVPTAASTSSSAHNESTTSSAPAAPSAFGVTASLANNSSFADLLSGKNTSKPASSMSSGFTGFGFGSTTGGNIPSFSSLGSAPKISSGFGNLSTSNTSTAPSFGSTSFGSTLSKPTTTSTLGSTSSSNEEKKEQSITSESKAAGGLFGSIKSNEPPTSAFGSLSTTEAKPAASPTAFGSSFAKNQGTSTFGSTSTLGSGGFGALAKNTVPNAKSLSSAPTFGSTSALVNDSTKTSAPTTSAFGSTSTLGSNGFGALAKNTVPGAKSPSSAPAFGSTSTLGGGLFGSSAKTSSTTASSTPAFGSTSTLGSGGFGALSKNTVPTSTTTTTTTTTPTFGSTSKLGFGTTTTPATSTAVSTTSTTTTTTTSKADDKSSLPTMSTNNVKPAITSTPSTKATTANVSSETKVQSVVQDSMAKEYENLYVTVTKDIEQLKKHHEKVMVGMKANTLQLEPKSKNNITDTDKSWNLNDVTQLGTITDELVGKIIEGQLEVQKLKEAIEIALENCKKAMDKKEDIKHLLKTEFDPIIVDIMDNRELDIETKTSLVALETKSEACVNTLEKLELRLQDKAKRNKLRNDHLAGQLSLYSVHRSIRDIERGITHKNNDINELEEKVAMIRLDGSRQKAKQTSRGISCEDLSDSEEENDENRINAETIENTTRYIRRYNFFDVICNETSKRKPIQTIIAE